MKGKLLFFITEDWYFWSHRLGLARAAKSNGFNVVVVTNVTEHGDLIRKEGFKLIPISLSRRNKNPFNEIRLINKLVKIYREEKPDIVHHVAIKPILYGSFVSCITRPLLTINAFAGMGYIFISDKWLTKILLFFVKRAYSILLNRSNSQVIVQNIDDEQLLISECAVKPNRIILIRGSGVDLKLFVPTPESSGVPVVILASRMLWDKGIREFVEAARELRCRGTKARFVLVGDIDDQNPAAVPTKLLLEWKKSGIVEWWGKSDDMQTTFTQAHIVCLPSYREGLPKVLIEAAACCRPIVTTDVPGCREVVHDGDNGLLVPLKDISALVDAIQYLIDRPLMRKQMGNRGRRIVEEEFSQDIVVKETIDLYMKALLKK